MKKTIILILTLCTAFFALSGCSSDSLQNDKYIIAKFDVTVNEDASITVNTNLPDETELILTLTGVEYVAQGKVVVNNGQAKSERFTNSGKDLKGDFLLEVVMPIVDIQPESVKEIIGYDGENLKGPNVKDTLGSVTVAKSFKITF